MSKLKRFITFGTNTDNTLTGSDRLDIMFGKKGDDILDGRGGKDLLFGGEGNDELFGGDGNDRLFGGDGDDKLFGGKGNDRLFGDKGNDKLFGGEGNDKLFGGDGDDKLFGGEGNDKLFGGDGDDKLFGGAGSDHLFGDKGDDTFNFIASENLGAKDYYDGGKGSDTLKLTLTTAEAKLAEGEIEAFKSFLKDGNGAFHFESFGLTVRNFEALDVVTIGEPENNAPIAGDDTITGAFSSRIKVAVVGSDNPDPLNLGVSSYKAAAAQLDPALFNATAIPHTKTTGWAAELAGFDVVVIGDDGFGADYTGSDIFKALFDFATAGGGVITTGMYANFLNEYTNPLPGGTPDPYADLITPIQSGTPSAKLVLAPLTIAVVDQSHPITFGIPNYTADAALHDFGVALDATPPGATPTAKTLATWTSPVDSSIVRQAIAVDELGAGKTAFLGNAYMARDDLSLALRQDGVGQFADQIFERAVTWAARTRESAATDEDSVLEILRSTLLADDSDADGDALTIALLSAASTLGAALSINAAGNVEYDPRAALNYLADGVFVDDSFEYQLSDGKGGFDTATVSLKVLGVADPAPSSFEETVVAGLENTLAPVTSDADALL